jgi:ring-1,2-phenylacetyl-CoA epoxidase subunit PaaE
MKKYKWSTHKVIQETKDTITIYFDKGQTDFSFQPGQYLNITCGINGERVSRSYSFSSVPSDQFPAITVKRVSGGKMSNYLLNHAKDIVEWDIEAPFGNFILEPHKPEDSAFVFLAGGSGISPLFSMLKSIGDINKTSLLLYSNKLPQDTIFYHELEKMQADNKLQVFYSFSASSHTSTQLNHIPGRFSPLVIKSILRRYLQAKETTHYFICGPTPLMDLYRDMLISMNVPERYIHMEYFDPVITKPAVLETDDNLKEVLVSYYEAMFRDEEPETYKCTSLVEVLPGQSLLEALKANGITVPSTCLKGTCGSCRATKEKGGVKMLNNYALTQEQVAEGKILLCQSFPMDQDVSITVH